MNLNEAKEVLVDAGYIVENLIQPLQQNVNLKQLKKSIDVMNLNEANKILNDNGYLMEDNQSQMSRKNIRKWLTSKYGIEFNRMTIGTYVSRYVVNVPDDERQPITALKIERYAKPIDDATIFDMFNEEGEETLTGGVQYEVSMENITNYSKQEMAKYFNDLFAKDSDFWEINRIK